jgi:hypothetical protein
MASRRKAIWLSDSEERRIQRGIDADLDNPESWRVTKRLARDGNPERMRFCEDR